MQPGVFNECGLLYNGDPGENFVPVLQKITGKLFEWENILSSIN